LTWLVVVWAAFVGAAIGSFLGVVIERVPKGESIGGRSVCVCGRQLEWWENIPIVSWLALRGRARCCGARIPVWYLLVEVATAAVFALVAWLIVSAL
jgi:leader peptidase (prepilin peptidase) / N-methyltransferase